jgi:hypothetical protein
VSARVFTATWLGVVPAVILAAGCAVKRIDNGVYHSSKGYRVAIPGERWTPVADSPADLELRHRASAGVIAVNATCDGAQSRRGARLLTRQLLMGVRDRTVLENGEITIAGRPAAHVVLDAGREGSEARVRIETIVLTDNRCVYDLMHVAPPAAFADTQADFTRFADSFRTE